MYPSKLELCGDVLARRLKNRPDRDSLIDRHIIPAHSAAPGIHDKVTQLERKKTGDFLQKKIRARPSRQQLIQRHILTETRVDPSLLGSMCRLERQRITDSLNERLQSRPGPIELIQEGILPVESTIQNVLGEGSNSVFSNSSPQSSGIGSPNVAELESGITTLNCTSPSPPLQESLSGSYKTQFQVTNDNINPNTLLRKASFDSNMPPRYGGQTPILSSQKENEKLVRSVNKKPKQPKTKVKKLKFHECRPPEMINQDSNSNIEAVDERYQKLLEQQTLYLRLQVLQQNAMMNALQGNTESMDAVTEEIENVIKKEKAACSDVQLLKSLEGKKLDELRVIDLRAHLKHRGLLVSGTKAKLIERLLAFEQGRASAADFGNFTNNNILNDNFPHMSSVKPISNVGGERSPTSTVMQVTTYSTSGGETYQVIQSVPQQSRSVYQVLTAHQIPQIQLNHVNIHPVVEVSQPRVVTIEDASASIIQPNTPPIQQSTSPSQLNFQMPHRSSPTAPTILIHSGPQLQKASLLQQDKPKVQVQQQPNFAHTPYEGDECKKEFTSSVSPYSRNKYVISPTKNTTQQICSTKSYDDQDQKKSNKSNNNNRTRSISEPHNLLERLKFCGAENAEKQDVCGSTFRSTGCQTTLSHPSYKQTHRKSADTVRRNTYDDIMDIIGELSTPSPSNAGSPIMTTCSSPNFNTGSPMKLEQPPPYNSCVYTTNLKIRNTTTTDNRCLNISPHNKLFSSVPENMNMLGGSNPTNNLLSSPYGSLSHNSLNGSLGSNLSGSLSNLPSNQSASYNNLSHSSSSNNLPNLSSSTGNIPHQIQSDNYQRLPGSPNMPSPYGTSPQTTNYLKIDYRSVSPMDLHPDDIAMDLDNFSSNNNQNNLGWLDLNMEAHSPSNVQEYQSIPPKEMHTTTNTYFSAQTSNSNISDMNPSMVHASSLYGHNSPRTQNSSYSGSSRLQEGCISLFDLESGEY